MCQQSVLVLRLQSTFYGLIFILPFGSYYPHHMCECVREIDNHQKARLLTLQGTHHFNQPFQTDLPFQQMGY